MDMGYLVPLTWYEVLPGDTIQQATAALVRVSPLLSPVMHPVICRVHHWFVPNRLIWEDWETFITGGPDGTSTPTPPNRSSGSTGEGSLLDYLGIRPDTYSPNINFSMLPQRAYQTIWNEYYRDQDLHTEATVSTASGTDSTTSVTLQKVCWEKDYFTSARPWEQKGNTVTIPLGTNADVIPDPSDARPKMEDHAGDWTAPSYIYGDNYSGGMSNTSFNTSDTGHTRDDMVWTDSGLVADLTNATGIDINDLRLSLAIQRYQEARARYGSRYVEYLRYLGVRSSDGRLQNPEYLGGGRQIISFSEVLATDGTNTGDLYGHGLAAMKTNRYRRFFEEHGIVMSLMSVIPKAIYADMHERHWSRTTKEDYFQRELQHIGEQEIPNSEVKPDHATPTGVFGYQGRYDEYRYKPSGIAGEFRSTLNNWHYARIYASDPSLNSTFVECTPTKRVNASSGTDCLYVMANHSIQARRMLSARAIPRTL